MTLNLYVVRDITLEQDWNIAEAKNDLVAMREFQKLMKDKDYPEEFKLYNIGWWDHERTTGGLIEPYEVHANVGMLEEEEEYAIED